MPSKKARKPAAEPVDLSKIIVSTAQAGAFLGITSARIRQLVAEGFIEKTGRDRVPLISAAQGYIKFLKDEERQSTKVASASRVQDARAQEIELRLEERSARLVTSARVEVLALVDEIAGGLKAGLLSLPAKITNDLDLREKLEDGINGAFREAALRAQAAGSGSN